jgi:hypothetical protein
LAQTIARLLHPTTSRGFADQVSYKPVSCLLIFANWILRSNFVKPDRSLFRVIGGSVHCTNEGNLLMKLCKTHVVRVRLLFPAIFFLASVPAYCQRATVGIDFGQTSDKFGNSARTTDFEGGLEGQVIVLQGKEKSGNPDVVAGGEALFPSSTSTHATEYAVFGGVIFHPRGAFSVGFHVQIRKLLLPPTVSAGMVFNRSNFELLQTPLVIEYKFGRARHAFVEAQGEPEFTPHFKAPAAGASPLPNPNFNYGYTVRGSVGYNFGKWYAKATYETRYFKFTQTLGNPGGLYNWRTDRATAGVGLVF